MKKSFMTTGLCLLVSATLAQAGWRLPFSKLTLAQDGEPTACIVVATNATRSAQFAARELQHHLQKITDAELPIITDETPTNAPCILVGESKATRAQGLTSADFQSQEYLIRFQSKAIILMGRDKDDRGALDYATPATFPGYFDEQATCYAVYDFLERACGVRWYLPTDLGLVCPTQKTLKVSGANVRRAPAMKYRYSRPENPIPADLCGDTVPGATATPALDGREQTLFWHRQRIGGEPYEANHSLYGYYARFLETNTPALFEGEHRDYFAQGYPGKPDQMCYSSTGLLNQVTQDANAYFDGKGLKYASMANGDYFGVVPMDNGAWCKCTNCAGKVLKESARAKGFFSLDTDSDYLFHFVNQIAGKVYETHPDKFIATLAYAGYAYPPSQEKLASNISIQLCLQTRHVYSKPIQDNDLRILDLWVKESKERRKFLWLYYCFPSLMATAGQWRCFPGFFAHHVVTEMATWHKAGIRGLSYEPSYFGSGQMSILFDQVEAYVTWKLADDPTLDGNQLIEEFFAKYYGAAAVPMKTFYNRVEEIYCNPTNYPDPGALQLHQSEAIAWGNLGTAERMQELGGYMEQARAAATTEIEKQRVALFDKGVWQYMQAGRAAYLARTKK